MAKYSTTSPEAPKIRPAQSNKPDKHGSVPAEPNETPSSDGPLETEGGHRSPLNGRFESDHRPSR